MITIQVRLPTIQITDDARRAIRFTNVRRQTMCSRKEAQDFLLQAQERALKDAMYRLFGNNTPAAVLAGADSERYSANEDDNPAEGADSNAEAQPLAPTG